jgi:DNA-binding MarR family transcriptional regulator
MSGGTPVEHPTLGSLSAAHAKLLFHETLTADNELSRQESRVAAMLISAYDSRRGYAERSLVYIGAALAMDPSNVARAIRGLSHKGWFSRESGEYVPGGRGKTTRLPPVAKGDILGSAHRDCAQKRLPGDGRRRETVSFRRETVSKRPSKQCHR